MLPRPFFIRRDRETLIRSLAHEVASASRHAVRRRVEECCQGMSLNELRGYIRARAAQPVRERTIQQLQSERLRWLVSSDTRQVVREATERVVQLVVRELAGLDPTGQVDRGQVHRRVA